MHFYFKFLHQSLNGDHYYKSDYDVSVSKKKKKIYYIRILISPEPIWVIVFRTYICFI